MNLRLIPAVAAVILFSANAYALDTQWSVEFNGVQYERQQTAQGKIIVVARGVTDFNATSASIASSVTFPNVENADGASAAATLPVNEVGMSFAASNAALRSVTIAPGIEMINSMAFASCANLESISIGEGCDSIGDQAFKGCKSLKSIMLPSSVRGLGIEIFADCPALESASLGGALSIPFKTFQRCTSLRSVQASKARIIKQYAFDSCTSLTTFTVGTNVQSIESGAFDDCSSLAVLEFADTPDPVRLYGAPFEPSTLTEVNIRRPVVADPDAFGRQSKCSKMLIGIHASFTVTYSTRAELPFFAGFDALTEVSVEAPVPPAVDYPLFAESIFSKAALKVPQSSIEAYRRSPYWSGFSKIEPGNFAGVSDVTPDATDRSYRIEGRRLLTSVYWENAAVYSTSGQMVGRISGGAVTLPARGIYLLIKGGRSIKSAFLKIFVP